MVPSMTWVYDFFDDAYASAALLAPPDPQLVSDLVHRLDLRAGQAVLDQCCGLGRLSRALAVHGLHTHGVDIIESYVRRATELGGTYTCADAGTFVPDEPVDCVINWWSSFGYSADDRINASLAERARDALRSGGTYALELTHGPHVHAHHQEHFETELDGLRVTRRSTLDRERELLHQAWTLGDDPRERRGTVRLFSPRTITELLERVGFTRVEVSADLQGTPLTVDHPRMVVVAS